MSRTHWCHERQIRGLNKCTNYCNGVCLADSFENFMSPCKYRHPYPPNDTSLEELCQIFASHSEIESDNIEVESHKPSYNPVEKAYDILYNVFSNKNADWDEVSIAIEKAIGFLGEALAN